MLSQISSQDFNRFWALAVIDGWDDPWSHTGTISAEVHNAALQICSTLGAKVKEKEARLPSDYKPKFGPRTRDKSGMTVEQFQAIAMQKW